MGQQYQLQKFTSTVTQVGLSPSFMSGMKNNIDIFSFPTKDMKSIYVVSFFGINVGRIGIEEIFRLPATVSTLNQITCTTNLQFVALNVNLGELQIWSRNLGIPGYEPVLVKELPGQRCQIKLTPDFMFILTSTKTSMSLMPFQPFNNDTSFTSYKVPWVKRKLATADKPSSDKVQGMEGSLQLHPFNDGNALVYFMNNTLLIYDTHTEAVTELTKPLGFEMDPFSIHPAEVFTVAKGRSWLCYVGCKEKLHPESSNMYSHLLVFSIERKGVKMMYQVQKVADFKTSGELQFIHFRNLVLVQKKQSSKCMVMRFVSNPKLNGKVVMWSQEFDLQSKLGVSDLIPQNELEPLIGFVNSEFGMIVRKPKDLEDPMPEVKLEAKTFSEKSAQKSQTSIIKKQRISKVSQTQAQKKRANFVPIQPPQGLDSDQDSSIENDPVFKQRAANSPVDQLNIVKPSSGYDPTPDNDSMDENYVKLETKGSEQFNKRPPPGSYELFSWAELFQNDNSRIKILKVGKVHCSGADFIKPSPDGNLLCLYGKAGFEIMRVSIKLASFSAPEVNISTTYDEDYKKRIAKELTFYSEQVKQIPGEEFSPDFPENNFADLPRRFQPQKDNMIQKAYARGRPDPHDEPLPVPEDLTVFDVNTQNVLIGDAWESPSVYCKLVCLRFRWKLRYQVSYPTSVEISEGYFVEQMDPAPHVQFVAVAFDNHHTYLYKITNSSTVVASLLTKVMSLSWKFPFRFKFILEHAQNSVKKEMLMTYFDTPNVEGHSLATIYSPSKRIAYKTLFVRNGHIPVHLNFGYSTIEDESPENQEFVFHTMKMLDTDDLKKRFHIGFAMNESEYPSYNVAMANLIFRNLQGYLQTTDPKSETTYLALLKNCFKSIKHFEYIQEPRLMMMVYVINQPGFFKECLAHVGIENLFGSNHLLELIFSSLDPPRFNSELDAAEMYIDCVKNKKSQPPIRAEWIQDLILRANLDALTGTTGCKKLLSLIILAPTSKIVNGLTAHKDVSLVPFPEASIFEDTIPTDLISKKVDCLLVNNPQKSNEYEVYRTPIQLDLTNGSEFSIGFFQTLQKLPDEELQYKYKQIINYKWRMVYFHSLVYTLLFIFLNVMVYLYFGYIGKTWMGVVILVMNILFIALDVKMFGSSLIAFSKNLNSWIDIVVHLVSATACIITLFDLVKSADVVTYIKIIAILVISVRGIIQMKVFSGIRILIMLIGQIIVDLAWVPIVLAVVFILAGSIYNLVPNADGSKNESLTFYEAMRQTFILLFIAKESDTTEVSTNSQGKFIRTFITLVAGSMFVQGIFNFVIAIFLQTFKKVNDNKDVYELRSLLIEITDYDLMLKFMPKSLNRKVQHHFLVLVPVPKDGVVYENETRFDRLNNIKDSLMTEMGKKSMELMGEQAKKLFKDKEQEIDKLVQMGKDNAKPVDPRVGKLVGALDRLASNGAQPGMDDLKNLGDLMCDAVDGKTRDIVKNTQKAITQASDMLSSLKSGENPSLEQMLDLVVSMAGALDPTGEKGLAAKLTKLRSTIVSVVGIADKIKTTGKVDLPLLIDSAVTVAEQFTSGQTKEKIVAVGNSIKIISEEGSVISRGALPDLKRVVDNMSDTMSRFGVDTGDMRPVKMVASILSEIFKNMEELKAGAYKNPEVLLRVGGDVIQIALPDSNLKELILSSQKILQCVRDYKQMSEQIAASPTNKMALASTMIKTAGLVVKAVYPEAEGAVNTVNDLCSTIESTSKSLTTGKPVVIGEVASAVQPLISRYLGPEGKKGVEAVVEMIKLVEHQIKILGSNADNASRAQASLNQLPELLEGTGKLIKMFIQDDQKVKSAIDIAVLSARLIQSRLEQAQPSRQSQTDTVIQTTLASIEVMSLISPKIKAMSIDLKKTVEVLGRQFKNFSQGSEQIDLESLLTDLGTLTVAANKDWTESVAKITEVSRVAIREIKALKASRDDPEIQHLKAGCRILNSVSPKLAAVTDPVLSLVEIGLEISNARSQRRTMDFSKVFDLSTEVASKFDPKIAGFMTDSKPVVELIYSGVSNDNLRSISSIQTAVRTIGDLVVKIEPSARQAVDSTCWFTRSLLGWIQATQTGKDLSSVNIDSILSPLCQIMEELKPEYKKSTQWFRKTAVSLQQMVEIYQSQSKGESKSVISLIENVGGLAMEINPRLATPVAKLQKLAGVVEIAVDQYQNPTVNNLYGLVQRVGELLTDCDSRLKPQVNQTLSVVRLIMNEINTAGSKDLVVKISDPAVGLRALFNCVKTLLTSYQPGLTESLDKIELIVSGIATQIEEYQKSGSISLESGFTTANTIIRELSPELQKSSEVAGSFIKVLSGSAVFFQTTGVRIKPSEADWTKIVQGVTQLAQSCNYGDAGTIRKVGAYIQPILAQLETCLDKSSAGFNFSKLFAILSSCVKEVRPELEEYINVATLSLTEMEHVLEEQRTNKKLDVLKIMNAAIKISAKCTSSYNLELSAFSALFQEAQTQISSLRAKGELQTRDSLEMVARLCGVVQKILEKYSPNSLETFSKIQKSVKILLQTVGSQGNLSKPSVILTAVTVLLAEMQIPITTKMDQIIKFVAVFESIQDQDTETADLNILVDSTFSILSSVIPNQTDSLIPAVKSTLKLFQTCASTPGIAKNTDVTVESLLGAIVPVIKALNPRLESRARQIQSLLQMVLTESNALQESISSGANSFKTVSQATLSAQRIITCIDPNKVMHLDQVASILFKVNEAFKESSGEAQNLSEEQRLRIVLAVLQTISPLGVSADDVEKATNAIQVLHTLTQRISNSNGLETGQT